MQTNEKPSFLRRTPSKGNSYHARLALGLAAAALLTGPLQAQVTLDPAWRVTPDTNKPGFKWSYFQAGSNTGNNNERTESDLAGADIRGHCRSRFHCTRYGRNCSGCSLFDMPWASLVSD